MRSVFLHFPNQHLQLAHVWLDGFAVRVSPDEWCSPSADSAVLWFYPYDDYSELEPEHLALLQQRFPEGIASIHADVSGRIPGQREVRDLALRFLAAVPESCVEDDYTDHLWSASEIEDNTHVEGHGFFDTQGWHKNG